MDQIKNKKKYSLQTELMNLLNIIGTFIQSISIIIVYTDHCH